MSKLNILGVVKKIKSCSNPYLPIIEAIINSIDSIGETSRTDGKVEVILKRENCLDVDSSFIPPVRSVEIRDNGVGFNSQNRDSFDTFYSDMKVQKGGKGFGRFMYLKYFNRVSVESVFIENDKYYRKKFDFGKQYDIIINETCEECTGVTDTGTRLFLNDIIENKYLDKGIETISRKLLENLLVFFVDDMEKCPTITIVDQNNGEKIILNDYLNQDKDIQLIARNRFAINSSFEQKDFSFEAVTFKVYFANNQKSRIILTGHNREVTNTPLSQYIPEFDDEFYDIETSSNTSIQKNYIVQTYVLGDYLNENVSLERETFDFDKSTGTTLFPLSQSDIERETAIQVKSFFSNEVLLRENKKKDRIVQYINETAPWHREYLKTLELGSIPYHASEETIEAALQKEKYRIECDNRIKLRVALENDEVYDESISTLISSITQTGKDDLAHYVCTRKAVIELFNKLLKRRPDGKAELEKELHNLIFPMGGTSETTLYENHNLWLLDERLVFSDYIASDKKISKTTAPKEPDLVIFDKKRSFRTGDNEYSNPLTVFEFKRPKRIEYSNDENPIVQVGDYVDLIRAGKYETPDGVEKVKVNDCTPVYGYVVCDPCPRIDSFAKQASLTKKPDGEGYFGFHPGYNIYIELLSFKSLLKNAELRNKIFFHKLKIE